MAGTSKREYMILSGEGTGEGTLERTNPMTETGIKRRLTRERCGGDRWANAYYRSARNYRSVKKYSGVWIDVETGEARIIPE